MSDSNQKSLTKQFSSVDVLSRTASSQSVQVYKSFRKKFLRSFDDVKQLTVPSSVIWPLDIISVLVFYFVGSLFFSTFDGLFYFMELRQCVRASVVGDLGVKKYLFRYILSRAVTWYFFDEIHDASFGIGGLLFPIFIAWHFIEPFFIQNKMPYSDRFEYCMARWPFFYALGAFPALFYNLEWTLCYELSIAWIICCTTQRDDSVVPVSKVTFKVDPLDGIEYMFSRIVDNFDRKINPRSKIKQPAVDDTTSPV